MAKPDQNLVSCTISRDYWADANEVFINDNPLPMGERVPAGMTVDIIEKRAFKLANDGVIALVIPKD
jgi:hypothetical protein